MDAAAYDHRTPATNATVAGCLDCYREHCRQQQQQRSPSGHRRRGRGRHTAARDAPATAVLCAPATDHRGRRPSPQRSRRRRRFDCGSCAASRLFIAGSFVIGLILVPCAMSAPVKPQQRRQQQQQHQQQQQQQQPPVDPSMPAGTPFWQNPCGTQLTYDGSGAGAGSGHDPMMMEADSAMRREEEIIDGVVLSANQALMHAEQFAGSFVVQTFHVEVKQLHDMWKHVPLEWLQLTEYMPKELDVPLDKSYMADLTFQNVLHAVNVGLQNLAVGLEQVAWDQERERLPFAKYFKETTFKLRAILCEVSMAIYELNETPETHVTREIMPAEARRSADNRSLRDWLILREYITGLQYVIETFEYLKSKR